MKRPAGLRNRRWLGVPVAMAWAIVACGPLPTTPSAPAASAPTASLAPDTVSRPVTTAAPATTAASATVSPPAPLVAATVDPGLLEVLPAEIDGVTLEPDPLTAARLAADPLLAESALSLAVAIAVAPGSPGSSGPGDLAVASVIRLRPDVFDAAFFQEWRDTYNEAACEVADGVEGEAEAQIGGRIVYVGTCAGGAQTYHTYLEEQGFIVSITASGERRFGELVMAGLAT